MIYSAIYEAKTTDAICHAVIQRQSIDALLEAVKEQVAIDFGTASVEAIAIFISETPVNGQARFHRPAPAIRRSRLGALRTPPGHKLRCRSR